MLGREPFRYTRTELASELLEVSYEPYDSKGDSRCAVVSTPADRAGPSGSAKIGVGPLSGVVHCSGSTTIRSSARDAAQLLVSAGSQCVYRDNKGGPGLRNGLLGNRDEPACESARRCTVSSCAKGWTRRRESRQGSRRQHAAGARLRRGNWAVLSGLGDGRLRDACIRLRKSHGAGLPSLSERLRGSSLLCTCNQ